MKKITKTKHQNCITFGFVNLTQHQAKRLYNFLSNRFHTIDASHVQFYFSNDRLHGYFICK